MREEDLEALRLGYAAWNRGDVAAVLDLVHPDIEWSPGADSPEAGASTGRNRFEAFIRSWSESFDELRLEPEGMTVAGDSVIVVLRQSGRGRGSGVELDVRIAHVWRIRDGMAVEWSSYRNRDEALSAIGGST